MGKVLVGYVSKTNTTKEIAKRIGEGLAKEGFAVDVSALKEVRDTGAYDAVVLGSPINAMQLLPEFNAFVASHSELNVKTAGLFVVSYLYDHGRGLFRNMIKGSIAKARLSTKARTMTVFGGRIPKPMPTPARLLFGLSRDLPLDLRDWDTIDQWGKKVAEEILQMRPRA